MSQSKKHSKLESLANSVIGLLVSYITQLMIFPLFGIHVSHGTNGVITLIFFLISFTRSYLVRRWFNSINERQRSLIITNQEIREPKTGVPRYINPPPPPVKIPQELKIIRTHF